MIWALFGKPVSLHFLCPFHELQKRIRLYVTVQQLEQITILTALCSQCPYSICKAVSVKRGHFGIINLTNELGHETEKRASVPKQVPLIVLFVQPKAIMKEAWSFQRKGHFNARMFARDLAQAWFNAKMKVARAIQTSAQRTREALQVLEGKDRWVQADYARAGVLRAALRGTVERLQAT